METNVCASHWCDHELSGDNIKGWQGKGGYCDSCWLLG